MNSVDLFPLPYWGNNLQNKQMQAVRMRANYSTCQSDEGAEVEAINGDEGELFMNRNLSLLFRTGSGRRTLLAENPPPGFHRKPSHLW